MPERIDLSTPDQSRPGTQEYHVMEMHLIRGISWDSEQMEMFEVPERSEIRVVLIGANDLQRVFQWVGEEAHAMIRALNTANLSTKSLERRILELAAQRIAALGVVVTGTPG